MDNKYRTYLTRAVRVLKRGGLRRYVQQRKVHRMNAQRSAFWERHVESGEPFNFKLQKNIRLRLYPDSELCKYIFCTEFEREELQFTDWFLRPGDIFVDVGANIGLFSVIAAYRVGNTGQVHAFEPTLKTYSRLLDNLKLNGLSHVKANQMAMTAQSSPIELNVSTDGFDAWNSIAKPFAGKVFTTETVEGISWDDYALRHGLTNTVSLMKIDVEGWETQVFRGGKQTFASAEAPVLLVEFADETSRRAASSCAEMYETLTAFGYKMFTLDMEGRKLISEPLRSNYIYVNLIATKQPDKVVARLNERCTGQRFQVQES